MIKKIGSIVCLVVFTTLVGFSQTQFDVSLSIVAQKNQVELGEPVLVSMRLTFPASISTENVIFPAFKDSVRINDSIDIINISPATSETATDNQGNPIITWQQEFTIALYAGGTISLPAFQAVVGSDTVATNILTFSVNAPTVNMEEGIKGMKDIAEDPYTFWELVWLFIKKYAIWIGLLVALILGWIIYKRKFKKSQTTEEVIVPKIPLEEQLLLQLEAIEQQELWQQNKHKEYYTEVTNVIRRYLEHKYEISTFEKTSFEILSSLKLSAINKNDYQQLESLFELADMIKFAKSLPSPQENITAIQIAKKLIKRAIEVRNKKISKSNA